MTENTPSKHTFFRVVLDYLAKHNDEISLNTGDVIKLIQIIDKNWAKGKIIYNEIQGKTKLITVYAYYYFSIKSCILRLNHFKVKVDR